MFAVYQLTTGFIQGFLERMCHPCLSSKRRIKQDMKVRDHLSEKQLDTMISDSFPASDPPSTY